MASGVAELIRPDVTVERGSAQTPAGFGAGSAGETLEDLVLDAWEALAEHRRTECPVCGESLEPPGCRGCGTRVE